MTPSQTDDLFDALSRHAAVQGHKTAVIEDDRVWTWAQLWSDVQKAQACAAGRGLEPGDWVGLTISAQYLHIVVAAALMRMGCCHVTLPSFESAQARQRLAGRMPLKWHVCDRTDHLLPQLSAWVIGAVDDLPAMTNTATGQTWPEPQSPRLVLTSSGSTGSPKLIGLGMAKLRQRYALYLKPEAISHMHATIEHNIVKNRACRMLFEGSTLVLTADLRFDRLEQLYRDHGINELWLTPTVAAQVVRLFQARQGPAFPQATVALYGAKVDADLFQAVVHHISPRTAIRYGTTEVGVVAQADAACVRADPEAIGRPADGVEVQIFDSAGLALPRGVTGEIGIRSQATVDGYLFDPDLNLRHFRNGWFFPGDTGYVGADDIVVFKGRGDEMMSLNGINIFPAEIEAVASAYPGVEDCAAHPIVSGHHGNIPALAVVAGSELDLDALARYCRDKLGLRAPRRVHQVQFIPRTALGKVQRRALTEGLF